MGDPNFKTDAIGQTLQIVLKDIFVCRIATAAIASQQDRCGLGITLLADASPVPLEAITSELGGVMK